VTDTALAAAACIIAFLAGYWIGRRDAPKPPNNKLPYQAWITPTHMVRLHFLGGLDERRFKLLCFWVCDGRQFRLLALQSARVLTRAQFEQVRDEMIKGHLAIQATNKTITYTRPGVAFFRHHAGRNTHANSKQERK
jgi:hypothetical protein